MCVISPLLRYGRSKSPLRHGIVATLAKRVASKNAPNGKDKPHKKATFFKCLNGIGRAGWSKPAAGRFYGRDESLVAAYQQYKKPLHTQSPSF